MNLFGITAGDPCGIGPEIVLKALKREPAYAQRCIVFGSTEVLRYYDDLLQYGFPFYEIKTARDFRPGFINVYNADTVRMDDITIGQVCAAGGRCAFMSVKAAIEFAQRKEISCVVTAPLNKEALHVAGYNYAGHTEIFREFFHNPTCAMLLWSDMLKTIHVTTHMPLRKACDAVTKQRVIEVIRLADSTLRKTGYQKPRIAVAGLNPHAGENGIFGDEEIMQIIPAVEECKKEGIDVYGPVAPDTVFLRCLNGESDIVVAMYHDQGHIPLKLLDFDGGVNITVGLEIVRTSVDHGTAFDIAGKLTAKEDSMLKAIAIGQKLMNIKL